jgi:hypothetical protein
LRFLPWSGGSIKTCTQLARLLVLQRLEESFLQSTFFPAGLWRRQEDGEQGARVRSASAFLSPHGRSCEVSATPWVAVPERQQGERLRAEDVDKKTKRWRKRGGKSDPRSSSVLHHHLTVPGSPPSTPALFLQHFLVSLGHHATLHSLQP